MAFLRYHAVLARKASRLIGAHELAVLGRGALALRREGLGPSASRRRIQILKEVNQQKSCHAAWLHSRAGTMGLQAKITGFRLVRAGCQLDGKVVCRFLCGKKCRQRPRPSGAVQYSQ